MRARSLLNPHPAYVWRPSQIGRRLAAGAPGGHRTVVLPWGVEIEVDTGESVGSGIARLGVHEAAVTEAMWRLADPTDLALDVGANIGYFTSLLASRVDRVVAFEAHPLLAERQKFNLAMIAPFPVMMPTPHSVIRPLVERMLLVHGVTGLNEEIETVSDAFGRAYVRQTDAVWIISEGVVANDVAEGQLDLLPVDTRETVGPVGFTTRTDTVPTLAAATLMQCVREEAAKLR